METRTQQTGISSYTCMGRGSHRHLPLLPGQSSLDAQPHPPSVFLLSFQTSTGVRVHTPTPFPGFSLPTHPTHFLAFSPFFLSMSRLVISILWFPFLQGLFHFPLHCYSPRIFTISLRPPDHQQQRHSEQIFIIMAVLSPHSKPAVSDAWGVGPSELCFNRPPRGSDACSSLRPLV